eukprot:641033-Alexandrium_andersonii.AAC.1
MGPEAPSRDGAEFVGRSAAALAPEYAVEAGEQAEQRLPKSEGVTLSGSQCPRVPCLRGGLRRESGVRMGGVASESPRAKAVGGRDPCG